MLPMNVSASVADRTPDVLRRLPVNRLPTTKMPSATDVAAPVPATAPVAMAVENAVALSTPELAMLPWTNAENAVAPEPARVPVLKLGELTEMPRARDVADALLLEPAIAVDSTPMPVPWALAVGAGSAKTTTSIVPLFATLPVNLDEFT